MKAAVLGQRFVLGALAALGVFGGVAYALLLLGQPVGEWVAVAALVAGIAVAARARPTRPTGAAAPAWLAWTAAALLLAVTGALVFGSLATPSRHWDGAVAWDTKAYWLTAEPTIEQPFFRDPGVFSHSRDYPLLQPLLIAAGNRLLGDGAGRLLFPFLYLLLVATVGLALRRHGADGVAGWMGALAIGLMPVLVSPAAGAVDSGYAEAFLATCLAATAAGLLLRDGALLFLGIFLAILVKPEGLIYGTVAIPLLWGRGERRLMRTAAAGCLLGAALMLPLQHDLYHLGRSSAFVAQWGALFALGVLVIGGDLLLERARASQRTRAWIAVMAFPALLLALPVVILATSDRGSAMGGYLEELERILERLPQSGEVLAGFLHYGFVRFRFGLTFWLLIVAAVAVLVHRVRPAAPRLWGFLLLGLLCLFAPFLLSPEPDMQHHLRSSMTRLQLHWTGVAWILIGTWLAQLRDLAGASSVRVAEPA